jgi:hypothetical protein
MEVRENNYILLFEFPKNKDKYPGNIHIAILKYLVVERHLKLVSKLFLQFDKEYLVIPLESMTIYGIMQEVDEFIDFKRNQRNLV